MERQCLDCSTPIIGKGKTGCCAPCARKRQYPNAAARRARTCPDCGGTISLSSKGRCLPCSSVRFHSDPEIETKRLAALREHYAQPEIRAAVSVRMKRVLANMSESERQRRREHGKRVYRDTLCRPDVQARCNSTEIRQRATTARTETMLAWCPPAWREKYRDLKKRGRSAAEAKRIIIDLVAGRAEPELYAQQKAKLAWCPAEYRDEYRRLAKTYRSVTARAMIEEVMAKEDAATRAPIAAAPPPLRRPRTFEEQLAAVRAGAKLVTVHPLRSADPTYTLGGIASAML